MTKKQIETPIEYRIAEIKQISFYEKDFTELGLNGKDILNGKMNVSTNFKIDGEKGIISFHIKVNFFKEVETKETKLFGIESLYRFQIKNFDKVIKTKTDQFTIPDPLMITFLNISFSGTRGMLITLITNPIYKNLYLPVIDTYRVLESLKKSEKNK